MRSTTFCLEKVYILRWVGWVTILYAELRRHLLQLDPSAISASSVIRLILEVVVYAVVVVFVLVLELLLLLLFLVVTVAMMAALVIAADGHQRR